MAAWSPDDYRRVSRRAAVRDVPRVRLLALALLLLAVAGFGIANLLYGWGLA